MIRLLVVPLLVVVPGLLSLLVPREPSDRRRLIELFALTATLFASVHARGWVGGDSGVRLAALAVLAYTLVRAARIEPRLAAPLLFPISMAVNVLAVPTGPSTDLAVFFFGLVFARESVRAPRVAALSPLPLFWLAMTLWA